MPVMHDDVHGTAVVTMAAAIAACRQVGIELDQAVVGQIGLGAAGFGIAALIHDAGVRVLASDPNEAAQALARLTRDRDRRLRDGDARGRRRRRHQRRAGLITPEMVRPGQVILALTNPVPEIEPDVALAAGAAFAADGTSVNNVLGYPGIFRGALLAGASANQPGDEARGRVGAGRPDGRGRARPRGARPPRARGRQPRPSSRPPSTAASPTRADQGRVLN